MINLESIFKQVSGLKLKGGLAGKICNVLIYTVIAIAVITWACKIWFISVIALILIFILILCILLKLIKLADKNPQSALMEGTEFLLHERMIISKKGYPEIELKEENITSKGEEIKISPEEKKY